MITTTQMKPNQHVTTAENILTEFKRQSGGDEDSILSDLLADLMHWCKVFDRNFDRELSRARNHFVQEIDD